MEVYIEYVIIDNFVLTFLIAVLSYRVLKVRGSKIRLCLASAIGTAAAVFYPLINIRPIFIICFKVILCLVLSCILFYKKSKVIISALVFFGITFIFGGVFFAIGLALYGNVNDALTLPLTDFSIGVIIAAASALYISLRKAALKLHKNRDLKTSLFDVKITMFKRDFTAVGFLDTGIRLYDGKSGLPVVVVNFNLTAKILDSVQMIKVMDGRGYEIAAGAYYMDFTPYGSASRKILILKPDNFRLYLDRGKNINIDVVLGLSCRNFKDTASYGVILSPSVFSQNA